ncbi:prolipoprotein diacylglyceryl transferase [Candidatus Omnitrophota bacterium]
MHPVILRIGPFTIYSYGLMLAFAFLLSLGLAKKQAESEGLDQEVITNLFVIAFISGIIGARVLYVLQDTAYYFKFPTEILMLQRGGLSWFGGLIAGVISSLVYLKRRRVAVIKVLDICIPYLALAQAVGRVGCLLNGCCYGPLSPNGLYFKAHDAVLLPTQLYSSVVLLVIFFLLRLLQKRRHRVGEVFFAYLLLYSFARFFIEFIRPEHVAFFVGYTLFQLISIAIFFFACLQLFLLKKPRE